MTTQDGEPDVDRITSLFLEALRQRKAQQGDAPLADDELEQLLSESVTNALQEVDGAAALSPDEIKEALRGVLNELAG